MKLIWNITYQRCHDVSWTLIRKSFGVSEFLRTAFIRFVIISKKVSEMRIWLASSFSSFLSHPDKDLKLTRLSHLPKLCEFIVDAKSTILLELGDASRACYCNPSLKRAPVPVSSHDFWFGDFSDVSLVFKDRFFTKAYQFIDTKWPQFWLLVQNLYLCFCSCSFRHCSFPLPSVLLPCHTNSTITKYLQIEGFYSDLCSSYS